MSVDLSVEVFLQPLKTLGTNLLFFGKFLGQSAKSRPIFLVTIYEIFSCKTVRSTIIAICKGSDQSDLKYVKDKNEYNNKFESWNNDTRFFIAFLVLRHNTCTFPSVCIFGNPFASPWGGVKISINRFQHFHRLKRISRYANTQPGIKLLCMPYYILES